jgi:hypothetical protein
MSDLDRAYLAGIIDADGYVSASDDGYAYVGISGTRRAPHDLAASLFGGSVSTYQYKSNRPIFLWRRTGRKAVPVLEAVLPYLRVKLDQALLALELEQSRQDHRDGGNDPHPWMPADFDPRPGWLLSASEIRDLNEWRRKVASA